MQLAQEAGFDVVGLDTSLAARRFVHEKLGFAVVDSLNALPEGTLDVVSMKHVLEHMSDPRAAIAACRPKLKPKGLFYVAVPNRGGWAAQILGEHWGAYMPGHLFYFRPNVLAQLMEAAGFRTLKLSATDGNPIGGNVMAAFVKHRVLRFKRPVPREWTGFAKDAVTCEYSQRAHRFATWARPIFDALSLPYSAISMRFNRHDELIGIFEKL